MASSPSAPNPYQTAAAQQTSDIGAAQASSIINNPNQYTPWGSRTYSQAGWETVTGADGKPIQVPRYTETTTLSPDQQRLQGLNTQMQWNLGQTGVAQSSKLRDYLGKTVDDKGLQAWSKGTAPGKLQTTFANTGPVQRSIGSGGAIRQDQAPTDRAAVEKAMMSRYNTDAAQQARAQDAQLAARGLDPGSAQASFVQQDRDRARTDAVNQAYLASGAESRAAQEAYNTAQAQRFQQGAAQGTFANQAQAQAYEQAMNRAGFGNQAALQQYQMGQDYASSLNNLRSGQMAERIALRNQPINEITALLGGSQVTSPQFQPFSRQGINAAPIGQYIASNYANQSQQAAATNAGLFGLGSAGLYGAFGLG